MDWTTDSRTSSLNSFTVKSVSDYATAMTQASHRQTQLVAPYADNPIWTTRRASLHNCLSPVSRHHLPALPTEVGGSAKAISSPK